MDVLGSPPEPEFDALVPWCLGVGGDFGLRGAAPRLSGGQLVGTLCVLEMRPHRLSQVQRDVLTQLARAACLNEAAPVGILHANTSGACSYTNSRWQEIFGLSCVRSRPVLGAAGELTGHVGAAEDISARI